jgi:hypothetical protein
MDCISLELMYRQGMSAWTVAYSEGGTAGGIEVGEEPPLATSGASGKVASVPVTLTSLQWSLSRARLDDDEGCLPDDDDDIVPLLRMARPTDEGEGR